MEAPIWLFGAEALGALPALGDAPLVWQVRLDDPAVQALAAAAPLRGPDLTELAGRPHPTLRGLRRQLAKRLVAGLAGLHPDDVAITHDALGAPHLAGLEGWHISLAGQWPHGLIGLSRAPLGVDIEPRDAPPPPEDAFTPGERAGLRGAPALDLLRRWTAKEAHAKLFGIASQLAAEDIETLADGLHLRARSSAGESLCHLHVGHGTVAAVARHAA